MSVSHLAREGLTHQSIKVYLSAVCNLHVSAGLHQVFAQSLTPRLEMVLKGIKKEKASCFRQDHASQLPLTLW